MLHVEVHLARVILDQPDLVSQISAHSGGQGGRGGQPEAILRATLFMANLQC